MELDFRNSIVLLSLAIHVVLLWILFRRGRKTPGGKSYALAIMAIAGWIFPMVLYRSHFLGLTELWARTLYIFSTFTSTTFFCFTMSYPQNRVKKWIKGLIVLENLAIIYLLYHPELIIKSVTISKVGEDIINFGSLYWLFYLHISGFFLAGFVTLIIKWRKSKGIRRHQIRAIFWGYFFASNLAMFTNLSLPWYGYFELNWLGQFFSTLVAVFTTYAILRHRLMNIRLVATEGFILLLNLLLVLQLIFSDSTQAIITNGVILLLFIYLSKLLLHALKEELAVQDKLKRVASSLEKANVELKKLDKQKTEFLSIASHQLRTPLSIIKGYIELLEDGVYGKPGRKMKKIFTDIDQTNERLVELVEHFLDVSRMEQGRANYNFSKGNDLSEVVDGVVQELSQRAESKGFTLSWKKLRSKVDAYMDAEKIRHVVFNYVDNAIKYGIKGNIVVTLKKQEKKVYFTVKDHGTGFNENDHANLFKKFSRGDNVVGTNVNGTGLGIYVCKQFIEAHGGKVWAESEGLGKGSTFGFVIPLNKTSVHKKMEKNGNQKQQVVNQYNSGRFQGLYNLAEKGIKAKSNLE